jgi:hypothetical protein
LKGARTVLRGGVLATVPPYPTVLLEPMEVQDKIKNANLLIDIFGRFPSFHDAEVFRITLDRGDKGGFDPSLEALIHVFEGTSEIDESGHYRLKNHVLVLFRFSKIVNLKLADFNQQNVLQHLEISKLSDRERDKVKFRVVFAGIFGVTASFHCHSVSIESVEPYVRKES